MRVLHVSPSVAKTDGGPAEVIRGLVPALMDLGADVRVLSTSKGWSELDRDLWGVDWLDLYDHRGPSSLTYSPQLAAAVESVIGDYDIVHVHGLQSHVGSVAMRTARRSNTPYVIEPHGALDTYHWAQNRSRKRAYLWSVDRLNWRHADGWMVSSPFEAEQGARVLPRARFFTWPLGVETDLFDLAGDRVYERPLTALYLGRITRKKRLDLLLAAMATPEVRRAGLTLVVAGKPDGTLGVDPHKFVEDHSLGASVSFVGPADRETRKRLLASADLFVLPSEDESFGVAAAEAMAAGLAVVSTDFVGAALDAGDGAVRVSLDHHSLAHALTELSDDPRRVEALARRGHSHAQENFTWARAAEGAMGAYIEALRSYRESGAPAS